MSKHTFEETTTINGKVYFQGDAELSEIDAKAVQTAATGGEPLAGHAESEADLMKMTKAELLEKGRGLEGVNDDDTKAEIVAKILSK